jgi:hypothetical protein
MARYTCSFIVKLPLQRLQPLLVEILRSCNFDLIYDAGDYIMAREIPGKVPFPRLVTAEILIDRTMIVNNELRLNFVLKNEELPLQLNNHCHQMFDLVKKTITDQYQWEVVENNL